MMSGRDRSQQPIPAGTPVEVYSSFRPSWVTGFEIAASSNNGYWLRRLSDGTVLPVEFIEEDVRRTGRS